jgi:hypothetical protein
MTVSLAQGVLVVSALVLAQLFTARADGGAIPGRVLGGARHVLLSTRSRGGSRGGCVEWLTPLPNMLGGGDVAMQRCAVADYAGLADR